MTILKTIDNYIISIDKADKCLPNWNHLSTFLGAGIGIVWIFISIPLSISVSNNYPSLSDIWVILNILIILIAFILIFLPSAFIKCGVVITLDLYSSRSTFCVSVRKYQFTDNKEKDAIKIQEIVDSFEKSANKLVEDKKLQLIEEEKKKISCCKQYNSIMELVQK